MIILARKERGSKTEEVSVRHRRGSGTPLNYPVHILHSQKLSEPPDMRERMDTKLNL